MFHTFLPEGENITERCYLGKRSIVGFVAVFIFALVETKRLLIQIPEQVERLNINVCAFDGAFEQRPEIFHAVRVNMPVDVAHGVINHIVRIPSTLVYGSLAAISNGASNAGETTRNSKSFVI